MALLGQHIRGCIVKFAQLQLEATSTVSVRFRNGYRSQFDTKARRARELRPRQNYLSSDDVENYQQSSLKTDPELSAQNTEVSVPRDFRHVMPEFLPDPNPALRDKVREHLERIDMYRRRTEIDIPEFYVGSIMAVTMADKHATGKQSRFVGICIHRGGSGLRANFTLRNVIDGQGVEILFDMYSVGLQKIEVLKLEKRLDDQLYYLRDAPPEYSTVPFDFEPVPLPKGASVPVNTIKVKLNPRPWYERWERFDLKGIEDLGLPERFYKRAQEVAKPWEKYDIMKQHRAAIDDDETEVIMHGVYAKTEATRKARSRQKVGQKNTTKS